MGIAIDVHEHFRRIRENAAKNASPRRMPKAPKKEHCAACHRDRYVELDGVLDRHPGRAGTICEGSGVLPERVPVNLRAAYCKKGCPV